MVSSMQGTMGKEIGMLYVSLVFHSISGENHSVLMLHLDKFHMYSLGIRQNRYIMICLMNLSTKEAGIVSFFDVNSVL